MRRLFDGISPFYLGTGLLIFFFALMVGIFSALGGGAIFRTMETPSGTSPVADSPIDTLTFVDSTGIAIVGDADADSITIGFDDIDSPADEECSTWEADSSQIEWQTCGAGSGDPDQNLFETIDAPSGTDPVADSITDTLLFATSTGITITGDSVADSITIGIDLVDDGDGLSATTSSESGLEFVNNELTLLRGCSNGQVLKWDSAQEDYDCSADSTGGSPTFDAIASGTNTTATMIVSSGAEIDLAIGGHVEASDLLEEIDNDSGATLFECTPVYISGFDIPTDNPEASIADSDGSGTMPAVGLMHSDVANGSQGFVVTNGAINGLDTMTAEGWTVGDILYVNDSGTSADTDCGNALTNVRPSNTDDLVQSIGEVTRVHATNGQILVIGAGRVNDVPNLADGTLWVGNASNIATAISISGDATVTNAGVITVNNQIKDTGDIGTGVFDFGGADSFEVPNAAGGSTVDASGEVTVDTTSGTLNFFATSTEMVLSPRKSHGFGALAPVAGDDFPLLREDNCAGDCSITLVEVCYLIRGGTNWSGQIQEGDANGGSGVDVHTADATIVANTNACIQEFSNAVIDAGDWIILKTDFATGDPTSIHITWYFTINP